MIPVPPPQNLPENVRGVRFSAPPDVEGVDDIYGVTHLDEEGEVNALEFQFRLTEDELKVLAHEPYLTLTILADHLHPFALQTSMPVEDAYDDLTEHTHLCEADLTHEQPKWWLCNNPRHSMSDKIQRELTCEECFEYSLSAPVK